MRYGHQAGYEGSGLDGSGPLGAVPHAMVVAGGKKSQDRIADEIAGCLRAAVTSVTADFDVTEPGLYQRSIGDERLAIPIMRTSVRAISCPEIPIRFNFAIREIKRHLCPAAI